MNEMIIALTQHELMEDADALRHVFGHLSARGKVFGGVYLHTHGLRCFW
jgi:uncharacterized membrane protein